MPELEEIVSPEAPQYRTLGKFSAIFSQAIRFRDLVFVTGQAGVDPDTEEVVEGGITPESEQVFENIGAILEEAGTSLDNVVWAKIYLTDFEYYDAFNDVYAEYFSEPYPARTAIRADIGLGVVEVEVIAAT